MGKISFRYLEKAEKEMMLPQLFQILHTNMIRIAPTDCSYEEDQNVWMSYILPALEQGETSIILMYAGEKLAGYFQYRISGDTLQVDEIEIKPEYQRTMVFYRFCEFLLSQMPEQVKYLTSYVHVDNQNSISIHKGLGMACIGKNKSGTSLYFRGEAAKAAARFRK